MANKRTFITIVALCLYVILFNVYIYEITKISHRYSALFYNYLTLAMIVFFVLDSKGRRISKIHSQVNAMCFMTVVFNFTIILLTHHIILEWAQPIPIFIIFNSGILLICLIVLFLWSKRGYFR